jgi:hypothetical protein
VQGRPECRPCTAPYTVGMKHLLFIALFAASPLVAFAQDAPSRPAVKGCVWEKISDATLGLGAWVERCDFGFRKIDFIVQGRSLAIRYSDGGAPDPLVDVFDLLPGESAEAGVRRIFTARTGRDLARRCVPKRSEGMAPRKGTQRFTFVPGDAYRKELDRRPHSDEVGEPPCGLWGDAPDGVQYFEVQPSSGAHKILFVRVGQETPLFDEQTLRLIGR